MRITSSYKECKCIWFEQEDVKIIVINTEMDKEEFVNQVRQTTGLIIVDTKSTCESVEDFTRLDHVKESTQLLIELQKATEVIAYEDKTTKSKRKVEKRQENRYRAKHFKKL